MDCQGKRPERIETGTTEASDDLRGVRISTARHLRKMRMFPESQNVAYCRKMPGRQMVKKTSKPMFFCTIGQYV
jgi:hypothetical protein